MDGTDSVAVGPQEGSAAASTDLIDHYDNALRLLALTVERAGGGGARDLERVMDLCGAVAEHLGLAEDEIELVRETARFRDLGKVDVPISILAKPGMLTRQEWNEVRAHPSAGERLLAALPGASELARMVRHVHERFDGRGYPDGIGGADIPFAGRIVHCCASFAVMQRDRPQRPSLTHEAAAAEIRSGEGTVFDPDVVTALFEVLDERSGEFGPVRAQGLLIVDDSRMQREFMRRALSLAFPDLGIEQAETAAGAIEALSAMDACLGMVCDVDLENEGDSERVIRFSRERHRHMPIVAISARMDEARRDRLLAMGADAALRKGPQTLAELPRRLGALSGIYFN